MSYKLSKYNCIIKGEKVAICNTFSGSIAVLEQSEYTKLQQITNESTTDKEIQDWLNQGFVVETDKDELSIVNYCRYRDSFLRNKPIYRILTTSACNARCFYCYEKGRPIQTMNQETAIQVANFIIKRTKGNTKITLNWFGGEPLLNPDAITLITKKIATSTKIKFSSSIITNASLFTKELINLARDIWNLTSIQITLDGLAENHEKRKAYVNTNMTFAKTIENISMLLSAGFHVSLRLNYDKDNYDDIIKLVYFIKETFGDVSNLSCYAYPLFNTPHCKGCSYIEKNDIVIYESKMKDVLLECGYYNPCGIPSRRTYSCFATDPYSFVINADGLLYKCTMDMSDTSRSVGNVKDDVKMNKPFVEWTTPILPLKCNECKLLPICQGGCRAGHILNIDMNDCAIKKHTMKFALNHLLTINTKYYENH